MLDFGLGLFFCLCLQYLNLFLLAFVYTPLPSEYCLNSAKILQFYLKTNAPLCEANLNHTKGPQTVLLFADHVFIF